MRLERWLVEAEPIKKEPIVSQCKGCTRVEGKVCAIYAEPKAKWRAGPCPGRVEPIQKKTKDQKRTAAARRGKNIKTTSLSKYRRDIEAGKRRGKGKKKR